MKKKQYGQERYKNLPEDAKARWVKKHLIGKKLFSI